MGGIFIIRIMRKLFFVKVDIIGNYLTVKVMLSQVKVRPLVHIKCKFLKIGKMDNFDQDALK